MTKMRFNGVLLNLYRDGNDSMGWHRDNEVELGKEPTIASVSFGASRDFKLRHTSDKSLLINQVLEDGSLLIMAGQCQDYWLHSLPVRKRVKEPRINLTFRYLV